jgi:hypothetical protein
MTSRCVAHRFLISIAAAGLVSVSACATASGGAPGGAVQLSGAQNVIDDKLVFGRSIPTGGTVSDSAWDAFMSEIVTPRFPAGLTVWHAQGQWLDPRGTTVREAVVIVEVVHPSGEPADSVFARVANEYRRRFHQDAVLRITTNARTELYESH